MKLEEKKISKKTVYKNSFLTLNVDEVRLPNDKISERTYVEHNGAAAILAITTEKKILLVKQFRYPIHQVSIEIPAGKKDDINEDAFECASRELEEETGYVSDSMMSVMKMHTCVGYSDELIELYLATDCVKKENAKPSDEDEFLELLEVSVEETKNLVETGMITDAKTLLALQYLWLHLGEIYG